MTDPKRKVERALSALRDDVWTELQHRRVGRRLEQAMNPTSRRERRWIWWAVSGAVATAFATGLLVGVPVRQSSPAPSTALLGTGAPGNVARTILLDGSVVDAGGGAQIRVLSDEPASTRVEVLSGRAEFEVKKRQDRPFVAVIRDVEVHVIGTHFTAELDLTQPPGVVRVSVQRGVVEVAARPFARASRLVAGDTLEVSLGSRERAAPPAEPLSASTPLPVASAAPTSRPSAAASVPSDASQLFDVASEARRAGNVAAAARAYASLLEHHPHDQRAGVAALELGRLQMDALHAPAAAAEAFRRAIANAPTEGIREDALSRLIEVLDSMGNQAACAAEKRRYQARYPRGVHAASVAARCAPRSFKER